MTRTRTLRDRARSALVGHPKLKRTLVETETRIELVKHTLAERFPRVVRPDTRKLTVAITALCNLRCIGCKYGRDFMPGHQLSLEMVKDLLDDGRAAGVETVRLYGGEPLLHPDLPAMVAHATSLGLATYVTTNGLLLREKIDALYEAGLRSLTIGFYGTGAEYERYVQRKDRYAALEDGVAAVREKYGSAFSLQQNFLIMRPSCNPGSLAAAWDLARRYDMTLHTDLIHYSLPYFAEGREGELQFRPSDLPAVEALTHELVRLKETHPEGIPEHLMSLRSIPDWLMRGPEMRIPCDAYRMLWIGADGTVQLCYVTFPLGNLHEKRLSQILYSGEHKAAARGAFSLDCPNCHCERNSRLQKHAPSRRRYGTP